MQIHPCASLFKLSLRACPPGLVQPPASACPHCLQGLIEIACKGLFKVPARACSKCLPGLAEIACKGLFQPARLSSNCLQEFVHHHFLHTCCILCRYASLATVNEDEEADEEEEASQATHQPASEADLGPSIEEVDAAIRLVSDLLCHYTYLPCIQLACSQAQI